MFLQTLQSEKDSALLVKVMELSTICFGSSSWSKEAFDEEIHHPDFRGFGFYCLEGDEKKLVAVCFLRRYVDEFHVMQIMTHPDYRRKNLAKRLLLESIHYAQQQSGTKMLLEVRASAIAAQALYKACGFDFIAVRSSYYNDGEDAFLYQLMLDL